MTPEEEVERLDIDEQMAVAELLARGARLISGQEGQPPVFTVTLLEFIGSMGGRLPGEGEQFTRLDSRKPYTASNIAITEDGAHYRLRGPTNGRFKGVSETPDGTFRVISHWEDRTFVLGNYPDEDFAARVYDAWACNINTGKEYLNWPDEHSECVSGCLLREANAPRFMEHGTARTDRYEGSEYTGVFSDTRTSFWEYTIRKGTGADSEIIAQQGGFRTPEDAHAARQLRRNALIQDGTIVLNPQGTSTRGVYQKSRYKGVYSIASSTTWLYKLNHDGEIYVERGFLTEEAANDAREAKLAELGARTQRRKGTGIPGIYQASKYTGVYSQKNQSTWDYRLKLRGKQEGACGFATPEEAYQARQARLTELKG